LGGYTVECIFDYKEVSKNKKVSLLLLGSESTLHYGGKTYVQNSEESKKKNQNLGEDEGKTQVTVSGPSLRSR